MTKKIPSYLKLHTEELTEAVTLDQEQYAGLQALCKAFRRATGWPLSCHTNDSAAPTASWSVSEPRGFASGRHCLRVDHRDEGGRPDSAGDSSSRSSLEGAEALAAELQRVLGELDRARHAVWEREAELAAGVPITPRLDEEEHLAARLEAVLRGGAEGVGGRAAAVYLLDETTSVLKLRSSWGLTKDRFLEPARPLRGAVADLEALLGHAVVLEDAALLPGWNPPEQFASAVCVPIATPTAPLGTLWVFCDQVRDFNSTQTNIIEIVAGRVAVELEREMLLQQGLRAQQLDRRLVQAAGWQDDRLPRVSPLLDNWDLAGWTSQAQWVGGDFHDWSVLADGALAVTVGNAEGDSIEASLTAAALQTAVRCHSGYRHNAAELLARINETFWTGSVGGQCGSLFYALIQPETGSIDCCSAGRVSAILAHSTRFELLADTSPPLGAEPGAAWPARSATMRPGDALLAVSEGVREARDGQGRRLDERTIARKLHHRRDATAEQIIDELRDLLETRCIRGPADDRTLLVAKRRK